MSGSGADIGFDYQADAIAYISAHGLSGQPLSWFDDHSDVPISWLAETAGPGDDIRVTTAEGLSIEVQAKHGLKRGEEYDSALRKLVGGLEGDSQLRAVLLVDRHASEIIREDLKRDILRLGQGRSDRIKRITEELLSDLKKHGLTDVSVLSRLRIAVLDLDDGSDGVSAAQSLLSSVVAAKDSTTAFRLLGKRGHELIKNRGQDDIHRCARSLESAVGLSPGRTSPAISCVRFAAWVRSSNEAFYSPALQKSFPIRQAWSEVILMDQLGENESPASGLDGLESRLDAMLVEVLRGMIVGLRLHPEKLAKEANGWLSHLSGSDERLWPSRAGKRELDASLVRSACLDLRLLAEALQHPSWFVAWNAARLFEACGPTVRHQELLGLALSQAQGTALFLVGSLADSIWGGDAFRILKDRLGESLTAGCGYLYEPLVRAARNPDESAVAVSKALHGIAHGDSETAEMAAEALCAADAQAVASQADGIRSLFDEWLGKPSWCKECNRSVPGRSCDSCSVIPPHPNVPLVRVLARIRALSVPDLIGLAREGNFGAGEEARRAVVNLALDDVAAMNALISEINAGRDPRGLLDELLKQAPDRLRRVSDQILELLQSPFAAVRQRVIASLSSGWTDASTARELALKAIQDDSPPVRSAAAGFLKRQAQA